MVNGKLEEPFIKFASNTSDLKQLSPATIKSELTKKFYEEIDFEKIEKSEGIDANYMDMMNYAVFGLIKLTFGE